MGRLDEIAARNRKAMKGDGLLLRIFGGFAGTPITDEPDTPGMRRKSKVSPLVVIPFMLVLFGIIFYVACQRSASDRVASPEEELEQERRRAREDLERSK